MNIFGDFERQTNFELARAKFVNNLRRARKGAAAGPSGMTSEHLQLLLRDERSTDLILRLVQLIATGDLPPIAISLLRQGRLTALQKPNGKIRGIVSGEIVRRLVARTLAQQYATEFREACEPHQFALSTRAGTECVIHALRAASEIDPSVTITSIDGVGAFDFISRRAMLEGLQRLPEAKSILPFVHLFYGSRSTYIWHDDNGIAHDILQAEGGEQGDPLMPALFSLGLHVTLSEVSASLRDDEKVFAYLDDIYIVAKPSRTRELYDTIRHSLEVRIGISTNEAKTRCWNAQGVMPPNMDHGWRGGDDLPTTERGLIILGTPVGHDDFVQTHLEKIRNEQETLVEVLKKFPDTQAAWLILSMCVTVRPNYLLRSLPPNTTQSFAKHHDDSVWKCICELLGTDAGETNARQLAELPLRLGGLGLRSAVRTAPSAFLASWADCMPTLAKRYPQAARRLLQELECPHPTLASVKAARDSEELLRQESDTPLPS